MVTIRMPQQNNSQVRLCEDHVLSILLDESFIHPTQFH
jgi:hypothetical protein